MDLAVLFVDDDPSVRMIAELALVDIGGMRVAMAESGEAAIALAARDLPDVVLLDVVLPDMDGPEVLERLRALPAMAEVPVVFCTARADDRDQLLALGAVGVIPKPLDPMSLASLVRRLVGRDT